ncbi:MAG TPA: alpha/beta hydrolase domain-containing protein [Acidimicrobiales bacterium]|nr:alpha/beta hydrolase domain-containing protein [Acidimicrobiales bacterium]
MRRRRRSRARTQTLLALALAAVLVTMTACSGSGDDDDAGDGGGGGGGEDAPAGPVPGADVAHPTVTGPVTGGEHDAPFNAMPGDIGERYGYVEDEYFLAGDATAYAPDGDQGDDGHWAVSADGTAPYETRVLVRRPADPDDFDGTVFVEWFNVTAGVDGDPDFGLVHPELLDHGSAYVGVSAQQVGVEGGGGALPIPGAPTIEALKQWDPERYGDLSHPGDPYSYDIFSQVAQALRRPGDVDLLDGMPAGHVIAMGESQSAARMVTYVDAVQPVAGIYDGFLIHSRGGGGAPLADSASVLGVGSARIRDDLGVPVLQYLTETDLFGPLAFQGAAQDDTDLLRTWEVAGTAHADRGLLDYNKEMAEASGLDLADLCGSINEGSQGNVLRAAVAALRAWVVDGDLPPEAPRFEVEGDAIARDERGIAKGAIRTPAVDAPVSVLTGEAPPGRSVICSLFGDTRPFDAATLAELYPTHQDYVDAVTESADAAVDDGFLRRAEADDIIAAAEDAAVPG